MKTLSKSDIKTNVRLFLDEQGINESEFSEFETSGTEHDEANLDAIIESKALEALRYVHGNADVGLLEDAPSYDVEDTDDTIVPPYVTGVFQLPATYLRVCHAGCASWPRRVSGDEIILYMEPGYSKLRDKFSTGTWERPKVGMRDDLTLDLFSMKDSDDTATVNYLSQPTWTNNSLSVCNKVEDAFYYYLAGLVCMVLGDERQQGFFQQAAELMGKTTNNQE